MRSLLRRDDRECIRHSYYQELPMSFAIINSGCHSFRFSLIRVIAISYPLSCHPTRLPYLKEGRQRRDLCIYIQVFFQRFRSLLRRDERKKREKLQR